MRGLSADERATLIRDAFSVSGGFLALEVDASWHPGSVEPTESCVVLADLDSLDASAGLDADGAKAIRDLLEIGHVRGQPLPAPVEVGSVRFRVAPADEFGPAMSYLVTDGTETLLEATVPVPHADLLPALVAVHRERGVRRPRRASTCSPHGSAWRRPSRASAGSTPPSRDRLTAWGPCRSPLSAQGSAGSPSRSASTAAVTRSPCSSAALTCRRWARASRSSATG